MITSKSTVDSPVQEPEWEYTVVDDTGTRLRGELQRRATGSMDRWQHRTPEGWKPC